MTFSLNFYFPSYLRVTIFEIILHFFFWPHRSACGILVPRQPGLEPGPSAVRAWSPNPWTAREFPEYLKIILNFLNNFQKQLRKAPHTKPGERRAGCQSLTEDAAHPSSL